LLEKIIEINNMRNIDLRNKACGDKKGPAVLIAGINSSVSTADLAEKIESFTPCNNFNELLDTYRTNGVPTKVDMVTLDEDLIDVEDIAFIKIDCEGYEYQVLSGAKRIMEEDRPFLLVELHPVYLSLSKHGTKELCDLLRHHYDLEFWDFGQLQRENRYLRFLSRYLPNKGYKFSSEEELLEKISKKPTPFQLYILAQPKK
jgi:FkbM family methyltransferase